MPGNLVTAVDDAVFPEPSGVGWIHAWELPHANGSPPRTGELIFEWVTQLLEAVSLPHSEIGWFAWNPFHLELPSAWREGEPGPLDHVWTEARAFHERLEIRLRRLRAAIRVRLLTEDEAVVAAASALAAKLFNEGRQVSEDKYQTLPGQVLLVGRPLPWEGFGAEELRGEVRFPRLLRYEAAGGVSENLDTDESAHDTGGRLRVHVTHYLDQVFRLRAVRYRRIGK